MHLLLHKYLPSVSCFVPSLSILDTVLALKCTNLGYLSNLFVKQAVRNGVKHRIEVRFLIYKA
jgi:hypothetical protein